MSGIGAIISFDLKEPVKKLHQMLAWTNPEFAKGPVHPPGIATIENSSIGTNHREQYCQKETVSVVISGSLIGTEKLPFQASTDADLVAQAFERFGADCFSKLDGQFAILLVDHKKKELYAVRDKTGAYPLFWYANKHCVLLATSIKALLATGVVAPTADMTSIASYLALGYISQDATAIQDVNKVLPGYYVKLSFAGKTDIRPFWSFSSTFAHGTHGFDSSLEIYCETSRSLQEAISERLHIQHTSSATLSGEKGSYLLGTFLDQPLNDPDSRILSVEYAKQHKEGITCITPEDFIDSLVPMIWAQETPIAQIDSVRQWRFINMCKEQKLTPYFDTGFAQEFYVYPTAAEDLMSHDAKIFKEEKWFQQKLWKIGLQLAPRKTLVQLRKQQQTKPQVSFFEKHALLDATARKKACPQLEKYFDFDLFINQFYHLSRLPTLSASLYYLNMKTVAIDCVQESRLQIARAHGVQGQSPFLDSNLLEFFASLNPQVWASPDILASYPNYVLKEQDAPLTAYNLPMTPTIPSWWMASKPIVDLFQLLKEGLLVESGIISQRWLEKKLEQPTQSFHQLYGLIVLELWMRLFIDIPLKQENATLRLSDLLR